MYAAGGFLSGMISSIMGVDVWTDVWRGADLRIFLQIKHIYMNSSVCIF